MYVTYILEYNTNNNKYSSITLLGPRQGLHETVLMSKLKSKKKN